MSQNNNDGSAPGAGAGNPNSNIPIGPAAGAGGDPLIGDPNTAPSDPNAAAPLNQGDPQIAGPAPNN